MIDTHQHLLDPSRFSYGWARDFPALQGRFALEEYRAATDGLPVEGTIFMEGDVDAGQSAGEAANFCKLAEDPDHRILGVVAAAKPENPGFEASLNEMAHPKLKGIRRVLHTQPDELSESALFRKNIASLAGRRLTFDLCVQERQLPLAIALVDACPETQFILDHCGGPDIAANTPDFWRSQISELAKRPNVACKVSGVLVYALEAQCTGHGLLPWFSHVVESFDWDRLVWGGDWPVCLLAAPLGQWVTVTKDFLDLVAATPAQRDGLLHSNSKHIYSL